MQQCPLKNTQQSPWQRIIVAVHLRLQLCSLPSLPPHWRPSAAVRFFNGSGANWSDGLLGRCRRNSDRLTRVRLPVDWNVRRLRDPLVPFIRVESSTRLILCVICFLWQTRLTYGEFVVESIMCKVWCILGIACSQSVLFAPNDCLLRHVTNTKIVSCLFQDSSYTPVLQDQFSDLQDHFCHNAGSFTFCYRMISNARQNNLYSTVESFYCLAGSFLSPHGIISASL